MALTVVIPAHNEADCIGDAIRAAFRQHPARVIVVSDNSTDGTPDVARRHGADVIETVGNTARKAGALNQALAQILPGLSDSDRVLCVDADTELSPTFAARADRMLAHRPDVAAVGGVFRGEAATNCIEQAQANEYARYAREITRTRRTMVLSGTSSYFRVSALRAVFASRGYHYDETAITEDNELSLALRTLGYRIVLPEECAVTTELMPTVGDLHRQRLRWFRGAVENLLDYGLTRVTARYWFQQIMLTWGLTMMGLLVVLTVVNLVLFGFETHWLWMTVTVVFVLERVVTVWRRSDRSGRVMAALMLPELAYSALLYVAFAHAIVQIIRKRDHEWSHLSKETAHV